MKYSSSEDGEGYDEFESCDEHDHSSDSDFQVWYCVLTVAISSQVLLNECVWSVFWVACFGVVTVWQVVWLLIL